MNNHFRDDRPVKNPSGIEVELAPDFVIPISLVGFAIGDLRDLIGKRVRRVPKAKVLEFKTNNPS